MTNRIVCLIMALIAALSSATGAADRKWQTGTWRDSGDARTYVITTATIRLYLEDGQGSERRALEAPAGTPVKFVIEGSRAFVLDRQGAEHELHVLRTVDLNYTATGGGHYIKAMSEDGLRVTLEDNSIWELDPRSQFFTVEWEALQGIVVRRSDSEQNFDYEIDNTNTDDGALARYTPR
jgi:hypothetical protein